MKKYTKQLAIATAVAALAVSASVSQGAVTATGPLVNNLIQSATSPTPGAVAGTVSSWVLSGFNAAGLTFVYQITDNGPDSVLAASFSTFPGSAIVSTGTGANGETASALFGIALTGGSSAGAGTFAYNTVTGAGAATFNGNLPIGDISDYLYINTDLTSYGTGIGNEIDNFTAGGAIYAPIPEPTTIVAGALMLLPLGIGAMRSLRKDRTV
jgi:hypothetical protein